MKKLSASLKEISPKEESTFKEAYLRSIELLKGLVAGPKNNHLGFFASSFNKDNYKRLFARDAFWICMASILSEDKALLQSCRESIRTLAKYQRKDGAVPSNVSRDGEVSYGIINPRVDPTTLYIIVCSRFAKRYPREKVEKEFFSSVEKAVRYLEKSWEADEYKLLYIPRSGNWADEYLQKGFVLYDEVLWYLALKEFSDMLLLLGDKRHLLYWRKAEGVKAAIQEKFWVKNLPKKDVISERVFRKIDAEKSGYFIHFFDAPSSKETGFQNPYGIFDAFGNILAILAEIVTPDRLKEITNFIDQISVNKYPLIPAHYPLFPEETFRSSKLHQYRFKQFVGHYHNGGLWAWYTGPYVAGLIKNGERKKAKIFLKGIMKANDEKKNDMDFFEYHTGKRAIAYLEVKHDRGVDVCLSEHLAKVARKSKSMILFQFNKQKVDAEEILSLRSLNVHKNDLVKISAVGPDAQETLEKLSELRDDNSRKFFHCHDIILKGSKPGGVPFLGVSAAAYIIAYKAFFEEKVIFEQWCC